jgi:hypothetical protein
MKHLTPEVIAKLREEVCKFLDGRIRDLTEIEVGKQLPGEILDEYFQINIQTLPDEEQEHLQRLVRAWEKAAALAVNAAIYGEEEHMATVAFHSIDKEETILYQVKRSDLRAMETEDMTAKEQATYLSTRGTRIGTLERTITY